MLNPGDQITLILGGTDDLSYGFLGYGGDRNLVTGAVDPLTDRIAGTLGAVGGFTVRSSSVEGTPGASAIFGSSYDYRLTLVVQATQAYDSADDVAGIVASAVSAVTGHYPSSVSVTAINGRNTGEASAGAPALGILDSLSSFVSGAAGSLSTVSILLIVVIVGLVIFAVVKQKGRIGAVLA